LSVLVGGQPCEFVIVTGTTVVTCTLPSGATGAKDVSVTNPGESAVTASGAFTYTLTMPKGVPQ